MAGADDLMMRIYAAMRQKERELISERTRAAAAKARGARLGGDRGYRPATGPDALLRQPPAVTPLSGQRTGYRWR
jgi:DNA invertase Pin-like site-specific DNA recombinase